MRIRVRFGDQEATFDGERWRSADPDLARPLDASLPEIGRRGYEPAADFDVAKRTAERFGGTGVTLP